MIFRFDSTCYRRRAVSLACSHFVLFCGLFGWIGLCSAGERWTTLDGSRTVDADFVGLWGDNVVLELPGPRRVSVNVNDLIAESRIQARRMGEEHQRRLAESKQEIMAVAAEAAAPAPTPLPQPPTPPEYTPLPTDAALLAELEWIDQQNRNGHGLLAAFDALPPSYQADLERLLRASVAKLDLAIVHQMLRSIHSVGDLIVTRQRWIFSHPRLMAMDEIQRDTLEQMLLAFGGLIRDGLDPQELKLDELQTTPLRDWLVNLDHRLAPHIASTMEQLEVMGVQPTAFEVTEEKDGKATVTLTRGQDKVSMNYVTVGGKWVPEDSDAEKWAENMKAWEDSLASTDNGSVIPGGFAQMVPMMIEPVVQPAVTAQSARELHAVMDGWFAVAAPIVSQMEQLGIGGNRRGSPYGSGYEDDYDMEMDEEYERQMEMEMEMDMEESY